MRQAHVNADDRTCGRKRLNVHLRHNGDEILPRWISADRHIDDFAILLTGFGETHSSQLGKLNAASLDGNVAVYHLGRIALHRMFFTFELRVLALSIEEAFKSIRQISDGRLQCDAVNLF